MSFIDNSHSFTSSSIEYKSTDGNDGNPLTHSNVISHTYNMVFGQNPTKQKLTAMIKKTLEGDRVDFGVKGVGLSRGVIDKLLSHSHLTPAYSLYNTHSPTNSDLYIPISISSEQISEYFDCLSQLKRLKHTDWLHTHVGPPLVYDPGGSFLFGECHLKR